MQVRTNNVPRPVLYGAELTLAERREFDYLNEDELAEASFIRYKGQVYDLNEFMAAGNVFGNWHGFAPDSYFSGVLVRFPDADSVICATYST